MSGAVITVPYADLAFRSLSLVNHEYVDLDSQDDLDAAKLLCDNARHSGFTVVGYHSSTDGERGTDLTCPAIVRTEWGNVGHSKRSGTGVVWSLGAKGCAPHGPSHTSFVSQMDVVWPRVRLERDFLDALSGVINMCSILSLLHNGSANQFVQRHTDLGLTCEFLPGNATAPHPKLKRGHWMSDVAGAWLATIGKEGSCIDH
ncbi:hypothetical protein C8R47DRAFT_1064357 [Mycena vitilis]|nr:hypothetical protein C8R47DRAFT_1064357 [Mycena vitilis]